jgi:isopropylmalate/homocitrate/citramalate synthase
MNSEFIYDTTLRDGEQMPGVVFSKQEKIKIATLLSKFGVGIIDLMPAVSKSEREVTEYLANCGLNCQVMAVAMLRKDHIDIARDCGVQRIILFTSVSDIHLEKKLKVSRKQNLENVLRYVDYALEKGLTIDFAGEDSSRADSGYLTDFVQSLEGKIGYFLPCDTLGVLTARQTYEFIRKLKQETSCKIGLHIHNDFGQATANTLAGIEAGADLFSGTFNGIGERAGNAPIEEVVMALRCQYNQTPSLNYELLGEVCDLVERYSKVRMQKHKPIIGENAYSHESGLHVDGILKHLGNYENFDPETIGRQRRILFGKQSGTCGLRYLFEDRFSDAQYATMLQEIKSKSEMGVTFSERDVFEMFTPQPDYILR